MHSLADWQQRFIAAMTTATAADADLGQAAGLSVYRNNIRQSLIAALGETYPHTRTLLGKRFFDAAAGDYVSDTPPLDPRLMRYGEDFPDRLSHYPALSQHAYVLDISRLEWARLVVSHAAQAVPVDAGWLSEQPDPLALRLRPHPATQCVHCEWDIAALWARLEAGLPGGRVDEGADDWLVHRIKTQVHLRQLSSASAACYAALENADSLGAALEALAGEQSASALGETLGTLIGLGVLHAPDTSPSSTLEEARS